MCGICGKLYSDRERRVSRATIESMSASILHRGPDDEGYYFSGPMGLGFRRLSIIDLSSGHQPIANEDETVWIVFNGEIYNYRELRQELPQPSASDMDDWCTALHDAEAAQVFRDLHRADPAVEARRLRIAPALGSVLCRSVSGQLVRQT